MANEFKSSKIKTGNLLFDPKNTRIPADRRSDNQRQLLHQLLEHEDIKGLAASIAKLGLFPNERLVVLSTGNRFTVLEGNRRLGAIKLLINPELAPTDAQVKYFRRLSMKANLPALGKVDVTIAPDRIAAAPIIAALHIGESKRRWSTLQQARFYRELIDEGQTPGEIAEEVGTTLGQVRSFLRAEKLHRLALSLEYDSAIRSKIEDSRYPLTTLDRFIDSKIGRKFLGIELDDEKGFRGIVHPDRFKAVLAHVAEDIATTKGLTRIVNDKDGFIKYIEDAEGKIEKTKKRGNFDPDALLSGDSPDDTGTQDKDQDKKDKKKRPPRPSKSIIPNGFSCLSKNDRVRAVFAEIKSMKIVEQRNSTGVMVRVLLDIALWNYYKNNGYEKDVCDHFDSNKKRRRRNPDWTPPLRDLISYGVDKRKFSGMTAAGYKAVRTLASKDPGYFITIDAFNAFTHNPYTTPTEGDLRALWQRAEPLLEIILN